MPLNTFANRTSSLPLSELDANFTFVSDSTNLSFLQSGTGAASRTVQAKERDIVSVKDFGAVGDGSTDDTAAIQAAITALASTGGVIVFPRGTYKVSSAITVSNSNIQLDMQDVVISITSASDYAAFNFTGSTLSSPTLGSNAAIYATSVSLSAIGGVVAGGWLMFNKTTPSGSGAYRFISKVRSVSGSGPYTVVLATALPIAFATADAGLELRCISPLENVGVTGNVKFDGSAATGTTVHGIKALYCVNSRFSGIRGVDCDAGAVLWAPYGHGNIFDDCAGTGCGSASFGALEFDGQTSSQITNMRVLNGSNFGVHLTSANYCTVANLIGEGSVLGRCVKFQSSLENSVTNLQGHAATAANGVAISVGSCRNNFFGINANGNATSEGLWLSDQDNCDNNFHGVTANGNASRDIYIGATDLRNHFFGGKATNIYIGASNATCLFYGMNGIPLMGGYSSNAPVTLLAKTIGSNYTELSAGQIAFPATQNASADANTLDDYEEGTWTPVLTFSTPGDVSVTYSVQSGYYTKIGRMVHLGFNLATSAFTHTTASGSLQVTGSPFTQVTPNVVIGSLMWGGITKATYTQISPRLSNSSATIDFVTSGSGVAVAVVQAADMPTGGTVTLRGSVVMFV